MFSQGSWPPDLPATDSLEAGSPQPESSARSLQPGVPRQDFSAGNAQTDVNAKPFGSRALESFGSSCFQDFGMFDPGNLQIQKI